MAAVQWCSCSAASLNRWCHRPSPSPPTMSTARHRHPRRIGCVSVPRELAAATAAEAPPEIEAAMEEEGVVECQECGGAGWLLCGFCKGKKNNVKSESSPRIYRRCPTCKAAGYILCARCRVYRCITFPETADT
ncbi:uncharacterized protein LOC100830128 isoform X2 [Brachypodium distachyon]|uniref:Uncharacterized protein n=1 Tax=Brachypodium distachyon TaxID=15368 RepID=I1I8L9_BRADI|nr:uncharacterized protein LOC100830128 isoform X2 [Brachypodium distachyon]KQJ98994.1 hypothetical protein BRADI_3g40400v3 [Brachypodium distachyon]|eukprot:XP_003574777.1 uncharacterized protein LOC100830128 isoform X2 [Brachypodium distachyon]